MKFASSLLAAAALIGALVVQISPAHAEGPKPGKHRPRANAARHGADPDPDHDREHRERRDPDARDGSARGRGGRGTIVPASVGSPNEGHLEGGVHLDASDTIRVVPVYAHSDYRWGLPEMVKMLEHAAKKVDHEHPGAVMNVGDISKRGGGDIDRHHSHESGRDVDIGFYLTRSNGKPLQASRFVAFDEVGRPIGAAGVTGARFDDARNWSLVSALLTDPHAHVTHMFVAPHIRARLLSHAERERAPISLRNRAAMTLMQPHNAVLHDDHVHVRIACPKSHHGTCIEYATKPAHHTVTASHKTGAKGSKTNETRAAHDAHGMTASTHASSADKVNAGKGATNARHGATAKRTTSSPHARTSATPSTTAKKAAQGTEAAHTPHSRPTIAKARKRGGSAGDPAPPMAGVVPAEDDFLDDESGSAGSTGSTGASSTTDEGGLLRITQ